MTSEMLQRETGQQDIPNLNGRQVAETGCSRLVGCDQIQEGQKNVSPCKPGTMSSYLATCILGVQGGECKLTAEAESSYGSRVSLIAVLVTLTLYG
jgi:hypothetical protein